MQQMRPAKRLKSLDPLINRCVVLVSRPKGVPEAKHFAVEERAVPELREGEVLVHTKFWSVDPAQRGWANDAPNYLPPVEIGAPMRAGAVGEVVASFLTIRWAFWCMKFSPDSSCASRRRMAMSASTC